MNPQDLPDELFATTWTEADADVIHKAMCAPGFDPLIPLLRKAAKHIFALQERIRACDASCNCGCELEFPGDACVMHEKLWR